MAGLSAMIVIVIGTATLSMLVGAPLTVTAGPPSERLPFVAVDQVWTEVVHRFEDGPQCAGLVDGAGGHVNVIHPTPEGPRYFKAWFLGDRFVVVRYQERPHGEPPTEKAMVAWMGEIADDGRLRVEATVDGSVFADPCSWLMARDV